MNYNINTIVNYNTNTAYRGCLRDTMNMDVSHISFDAYTEDLDDETKDELLIDERQMSRALDEIYEKTCNIECFQNVFLRAATLMMSNDPKIGLAVLFSYDYFSQFHKCLKAFYDDKSDLCDKEIKNLMSMM